jgi:hypothetical protein
MSTFPKNPGISTLLMLTLLSVSQPDFAQHSMDSTIATIGASDHFTIRASSFLLPQRLPKWHYSQAISFSYVELPSVWTLEKVNTPMLTYQAKFTLPWGFNMQASLSTLVVSNRLNAGPFWNYSVNHFHFGIGYQVAYDFGYLAKYGYKTKFVAWEQQPSLTVGYSFKRYAVLLRGDLYWTNSANLVEAGHAVSLWDSFYNGYSVGATLEQRLYRNKILSCGFKISHIQYHFLAWPAFPVNQSRYYVPEFQITINI